MLKRLMMKEPLAWDCEESWERELGRSLRTARDLASWGLIPADELPRYESLLSRYKLWIPRYYASLVDRSDPACPIRRQAVPDPGELAEAGGWLADPLSDLAHRPAPRVTHRYPGRALWHLTSNCSMYCRYCFRKTLLNELGEELFSGDTGEALAHFRAHPEIEEVIFSGGDPFMVRDESLGRAVAALGQIAHLSRVRFHTRVPVTFPMRVTPALGEVLAASLLPVVVVVHFNHPRELTPHSRLALETLRNAGAHLLNQSVLLAGVNDDAATLATLSRELFTSGVLPYYLHHPDRARGTGHFDVPMARGLAIHRELKTALPGYLVPKYVVDIVGEPFKRDVAEVAERAST